MFSTASPQVVRKVSASEGETTISLYMTLYCCQFLVRVSQNFLPCTPDEVQEKSGTPYKNKNLRMGETFTSLEVGYISFAENL
jgi:hypothetical protein